MCSGEDPNLGPLASSVRDNLVEKVTTLLATQAAMKLMKDKEEENKYKELKQLIEKTLLDKVTTFLSEQAVEKYFEEKKKKKAAAKLLDDNFDIFADSVMQDKDMFRGSSDEINLLEEFRENGEEQNLVDPDELLTDKQSPILNSISNMDLKSDRIQEENKRPPPDGKGKLYFTIPEGKNPSDWEVMSSSFGAAEQAVQGKEKKIDPAMGLVDQALDIIAAIESN